MYWWRYALIKTAGRVRVYVTIAQHRCHGRIGQDAAVKINRNSNR